MITIAATANATYDDDGTAAIAALPAKVTASHQELVLQFVCAGLQSSLKFTVLPAFSLGQ